jgi:hypothetical protein
MLLKNLIQHQEYYKQLSNEVRNYIRNEIVTVLADDRPGLRRTCANVISAICCAVCASLYLFIQLHTQTQKCPQFYCVVVVVELLLLLLNCREVWKIGQD